MRQLSWLVLCFALGALGVCVFHGRLFALGGQASSTSPHAFNSVEYYAPAADAWRPVDSLVKTRVSFGVAVVDDALLVQGGFACPTFSEHFFRSNAPY